MLVGGGGCGRGVVFREFRRWWVGGGLWVVG